MCNLVRILTVVVAAVSASAAVSIESVFPVAELGPNMYIKPANDASTCKDPYFSIVGCTSCLGDCIINNGQNITFIVICTPTTQLTQVDETVTLTFNSIFPASNDETLTVNCAADQPCTLTNTTGPFDAFPGTWELSDKYTISNEVLLFIDKCIFKVE